MSIIKLDNEKIGHYTIRMMKSTKLTNPEILEQIKKQFGADKGTLAAVAWYRSKINKNDPRYVDVSPKVDTIESIDEEISELQAKLEELEAKKEALEEAKAEEERLKKEELAKTFTREELEKLLAMKD